MFEQGSGLYASVADQVTAAFNMLTQTSSPETAPVVHATIPPLYFFQFPPSPEPQALSPPVADHTFARPFDINAEFYNNALHVAIPISVAIIYATTVTFLNRVNKQREYKPWAISKSLPFYAFIVIHNIFLALYSGWTCLGMIRAITHSWPGWEGEHKLVGVVDTLCKINGPRGLGSAATFNHDSGSWGVTDQAIHLLGGSPDSTDVGRIWNEGLAFYGWLFYLSKFYELVDTFIILAKGKKSSVLQTYHHAGAMMCMWAGIRYMSPPIWMFVLINSGLHAYMYTYYTLSALTIRVPLFLKRTLTTLQIAQCVFGASYAVAHLFIAYSVPVSIPYSIIHNISSAIPAATSSASSAIASATATAGIGSWLKKVALRAAGEEGLAENVRNLDGETFGIDAIHAAAVEKAQEEIRYKLEYQTINCLDTSGEVFAILLNAIYLAPLIWLFTNFFIQTYLKRIRSTSPPPDHAQIAKDSGKDAVGRMEQEIREAMAGEQARDKTDIPSDLKGRLGDTTANLKKGAEELGSKAKKSVQIANDAIRDKVQVAKEQAKSWNSEKSEDSAPGERNDVKETRHGETKTEGAKQNGTDEKHQAERSKEEAEVGSSSEPEDISSSNLLDGDEKAYEVNPDEVMDSAEMKAEEELQPNGGT
ncbi:hypothetical protein MMC07_000039 [Pseudocyphellaria aurata]|nr:hypothetical protein [Pseudocyphellaria aurata]